MSIKDSIKQAVFGIKIIYRDTLGSECWRIQSEKNKIYEEVQSKKNEKRTLERVYI